MRQQLGILKCGTRYTLEFISNARSLNEHLKEISENPKVTKLFTKNFFSNSSTSLFGSIIYDMCVSGDKVPSERQNVEKTASKLFLLMNIVDDVIDKRSATIEEKFKLLPSNIQKNIEFLIDSLLKL